VSINNPNLWYTGRDNRLHKVAAAWQIRYGMNRPEGWFVQTTGQWLPGGYRSPDPLAPVNRAREWGLDQWPVENYGIFDLGIGHKSEQSYWAIKQAFFEAGPSTLLRQSALVYRTTQAQWKTHLRASVNNGRVDSLRQQSFYRLQGRWDKTGGHFHPYALVDMEKLDRTVTSLPDSASYGRYQYEAGLHAKHRQWNWRLWLRQNLADSIRQNAWQHMDKEFTGGIRLEKQHPYRPWMLQVAWIDNATDSIRNRWDIIWNGRLRDSLDRYRLSWKWGQNGSQILRNEILFKQVPDGQGQYQWIDYNGDGIAQNNEFEPAYYQDQADYIMVVLPSTYTLPVTARQLSLTLRVNTAKWWKKAPRWSRWLLNWQAASDRTVPRSSCLWCPFDFSMTETASEKIRLLQQWQPSGNWKVRYLFDWKRQKQLTYNGHTGQSLRRHYWSVEYKYNTSKGWQIEPFWEISSTSAYAEDYPLKDYKLDIQSQGLHALFEGRHFHSDWTFTHATKASATGSFLEQWQSVLSARQHQSSGQWEGRLTYAFNRFEGNPLSPDGFRMLEGMKPGINWIGEFRWQKQLRQNLFLQLFYQLRMAPAQSPVQTGQISLKARF